MVGVRGFAGEISIGFTDFECEVKEGANNAGHEVVGVRGFAGEISEAQRRESRKSNIGFTDFAYEVKEGSKSEIFRRCDAGASNENED